MRFSILVPGFLLGLITSTSSLALGQQTYRYVEIPLPAIGIFASGLGVNNAGDVCGVAYLPANKRVGFLFEHDTGVLNAFATLGTGAAGREIGAHSVNDHREVVGIFAASGLPKSCYWTPSAGLSDITYYPPVNNNILAEAHGIGNNGNITGANTFQCVASPTFGVDAGAIWNSHNDAPSASIDTPFTCGVGGMLVEINDHGSAVGTYVYSDGSSTWNRPLVVGPLGRHDLPTFNSLSEYGSAFGVNNVGYECGAAENRANNTPRTGACYWDPGFSIHRLDSIPASSIFAEARSINDSLDVVGWTGTRVAVIWPGANPTPIDLNTVCINLPPGRILTTEEEISNTGYIAGRSNETTSNGRAFLLEPCIPVIASAPQDDEIDMFDTTEFTVVAGGAGTLAYQWRHNGVPLGDGPTVHGSIIGGALTDTLQIDSATPADAGDYDVVITSMCGTVTSPAATLIVNPCPSDFDGSGFVDTDDFTAFVIAFILGGDDADFDESGFVDTDDFTSFVLAFESGC